MLLIYLCLLLIDDGWVIYSEAAPAMPAAPAAPPAFPDRKEAIAAICQPPPPAKGGLPAPCKCGCGCGGCKCGPPAAGRAVPASWTLKCRDGLTYAHADREYLEKWVAERDKMFP